MYFHVWRELVSTECKVGERGRLPSMRLRYVIQLVESQIKRGGEATQTGGTSKLVPNNTGSFKNKNLQLVFVFTSDADVTTF